MKRIFRKIRAFVNRNFRLFVGNLRDFGEFLRQSYEGIYLMVFLISFGLASGFWIAAMIAGLFLTACLCLLDFRQAKAAALTTLIVSGLVLAIGQDQQESPSERPKTRPSVSAPVQASTIDEFQSFQI